MTEARVSMILCGEQLDEQSEAVYVRMRTTLKKFIDENARIDTHKIGPDYDEKIRRFLNNAQDQQGRGQFCEDADQLWIKEVLQKLLQPQAVSAILKRLETPEDPSKGDCP